MKKFILFSLLSVFFYSAPGHTMPGRDEKAKPKPRAKSAEPGGTITVSSKEVQTDPDEAIEPKEEEGELTYAEYLRMRMALDQSEVQMEAQWQAAQAKLEEAQTRYLSQKEVYMQELNEFSKCIMPC